MHIDLNLKASAAGTLLPNASLIHRVAVQFFPGLNLWASLEDSIRIEFDVFGEYRRQGGNTIWTTHLVSYPVKEVPPIADADFPSGNLSKALAHSLSNYVQHKEFRRRGNSTMLEPGELKVRRITEDLYEGLQSI